MNDIKEFTERCLIEVDKQGHNQRLKELSIEWLNESAKHNYSYHFQWLGLPIIQYPQDLIGTQQLIWNIQPDLIIETGIARGGSLIFYASLLELIAQCGGDANAKVLGIDIDIRRHNRDAILAHPMSKRVEMLEGSSIDISIAEKVRQKARLAKRVMVFLDSNHTHEHVLEELRLYAPLVSLGSYIIVFDTVVEDIEGALIKDRPWGKGDNPKTAVFEYLKYLSHNSIYAEDGAKLNLIVDSVIENQLQITVAPSGFLRRTQ